MSSYSVKTFAIPGFRVSAMTVEYHKFLWWVFLKRITLIYADGSVSIFWGPG